MDCQGFDDVVMDLLYEQDRPRPRTAEEARRHAETCARCASVLSKLRHTRELVELPELAVPPGLEDRILAATAELHVRKAPSIWGRLDTMISRAGSYAMRPQLAMGALLMLMVGTSLLLLRARPAGPGAVRITEDGVPALASVAAPMPPQAAASLDRRAAPDTHGSRKDDDRVASRSETATKADSAPAAAPAATTTAEASPDKAKEIAASPEAAPLASAAPQGDAQYATAMEDFKAKRYADAVRGFDIVANGGGGNAPQAALYAARATRYSSGCGAALPRFDAVSSHFAGTSVAADASWEAAICYREVGQTDRARQLLSAMRHVAGYGDRAKSELAAMDAQASKSPPAAAAPPPAKAGAAKSDKSMDSSK